MIKWINRNKAAIIIFGVISALVPVLVIAYELIITDQESKTLTFDSTLGLLVILYYGLLILAGIAGITYWIIKQVRFIAQLKNEKTKAELQHLKAQVNPHFFFNMLNNLYGLVDKDSDKAKKLILKLSDM